MDLDLTGKVVCITGGSRGIGFATAEDFAKEGARVVICARQSQSLKDAAEKILASTGQKIDTVQTDVTRVDEIDRLIAHLRTAYGKLDVLVNNAGTGTYKPFLDVTDEELVAGMELNFFAQFRVTQRAVPLMREAGGAIINVSGRSGIRGNFPPGSSCTGPAKAAEIRFSIDLAAELAEYGIRVNCVVPGIVETERLKLWENNALDKERDEGATDKLRREIERTSMRGRQRWGQPKEISSLILYLASPCSSYINGTAMTIDGGSFTKSYMTELHLQRDALARQP